MQFSKENVALHVHRCIARYIVWNMYEMFVFTTTTSSILFSMHCFGLCVPRKSIGELNVTVNILYLLLIEIFEWHT